MKIAFMKKHVLGRRIAATAISFTMAVSMLPFTVFANTDDDQPAESQTVLNQKFSEIIEPGAPDDFSEDMANPYGYDKGQSFLLSEKNELLLYYTYETDKNSNDKKDNRHTVWYDTYSHGGNVTLREDSKGAVQAGFNSFGEYGTTDAYSYVTATSFDPTGSGRRDHVAYVGYENVSDRGRGYYVWILNTRTGVQYGPTRISKSSSCNWLQDAAQTFMQDLISLISSQAILTETERITLYCLLLMTATDTGFTTSASTAEEIL